ncbi:MAG: TetR family transcriptional regulator [Marmoricola sp.]
MPRIAESRAPAEPASAEQRERHRRILRAAARLGNDLDFDHVQMADVARESGVALGTLYRYFPSKPHLFAAVMGDQVRSLLGTVPGPEDRTRPGEAVARLLLGLTRLMLDNRQLSISMIQGNNTLHAGGGPIRAVDTDFEALVLKAAGWDTPSTDEHRRARLVMQCWYGVLMSALNGRSSEDEAQADIERACELLLG